LGGLPNTPGPSLALKSARPGHPHGLYRKRVGHLRIFNTYGNFSNMAEPEYINAVPVKQTDAAPAHISEAYIL
jgi:hypothetical protein